MTMPGTASLTNVLKNRHGILNTYLAGLRPLDPRNAAFHGRAVTLRFVPLREDIAPQTRVGNPEGAAHRAFDAIRKGDVLVIEGMGREDCAVAGDIIFAHIRNLGAVGVVADAGIRDAAACAEILPCHSRGASAPASYHRLMGIEAQCPVALGGCTVMPGDTIVADADGVAVLPAAMAEKAIAEATELDDLDLYIRLRVEAGESMKGLYPAADAIRPAYNDWVSKGRPGA